MNGVRGGKRHGRREVATQIVNNHVHLRLTERQRRIMPFERSPSQIRSKLFFVGVGPMPLMRRRYRPAQSICTYPLGLCVSGRKGRSVASDGSAPSGQILSHNLRLFGLSSQPLRGRHRRGSWTPIEASRHSAFSIHLRERT